MSKLDKKKFICIHSQVSQYKIKNKQNIVHSNNTLQLIENVPYIWWLGQAGFLIQYGNVNIIIDAYLSNALYHKYKDSQFNHARMMPPPIEAQELINIDYCFSTHAHSDHMDPIALEIIAENNPLCKFIVPRAKITTAFERNVPKSQIVGINASENIELNVNCKITAIPAAHEQLEKDEKGNFSFLGYIFHLGQYHIYHSGDSMPYEGHYDWLSQYKIDLALLPVNGRKELLSKNGIAGNFTFAQAAKIVEDNNISYMIPHHYGMFEFNTLDEHSLETEIDKSIVKNRIFPAKTDVVYILD